MTISSAVTLAYGEAESVGEFTGKFTVQNAQGDTTISERLQFSSQSDAVARIVRYLVDALLPRPEAIGHRIVHGGTHCREHSLIDAETFYRLEQAAPFAPLHVPAALSGIRIAQAQFPDIPHVACLDTAFHRTLPDIARVSPLPKALRAEGIERYGFHGLSCESIVRQLGTNLPKRLVIAHLGNGASVTAVKEGRSVDTSMGLTPSGGVVMGSRPGDLDPGVLLYLMREKGRTPLQIEELIERKSGLVGISEVSHDMRRLHKAASSDPDAALAIEIFCASVRKQLGAMATVLNGIDLLVFTGGIGEHDTAVRDNICDGLEWLG